MAQRITCPDCKSVLKPAKPVPDGKKVKCPKCGKPFTTPGLVEDNESPPAKVSAKKKGKAAIQKAAASAPPPKKSTDDEDEGGGVYGTVQDEVIAEEDKQKIEYAPDMSIKDLRGPAQAAVVSPSNYLILIGGLSCLCNILFFCISFWPMVFNEHIIKHEEFLEAYYKAQGGKEAEKAKNIPKERKDLKSEALELVEQAERTQIYYRVGSMAGYFTLLMYNALAIIGAVKMQNLESRGWGIASSIMTIIPFGSAGICSLLMLLIYILFLILLDAPGMAALYAIGVGSVGWVLAIVVGVWSLRTLMSEEVIEGFQYVAE